MSQSQTEAVSDGVVRLWVLRLHQFRTGQHMSGDHPGQPLKDEVRTLAVLR
jgi:hypothetical protein